MSHTEPTSQFASMEAILESVAQPVWVVDHDGLVVFVNPAGLAALGYDDLSELQGRFGHDAIHYKHRDGSPYPGRGLPDDEGPRDRRVDHMEEDWFVRRDGTMFPVSYTGTPLALPDGPGVVVAFKDIEEQRAAEQALREREAILATRQPVWVVDHDGLLAYVNPAALAALGYDDLSELRASRATRRSITSTPTARRSPTTTARCRRPARAGEIVNDTEDWFVRNDGTILPVVYTSTPFELPDGPAGAPSPTSRSSGRAEQAARERDVAQARAEELRSRAGASSRPPTRRARSSNATCTTAPSSSSSARCSTCRWPSASAASDPEARGSCARRRSSWRDAGIDELRRLAAGIHPAILTDRGLGPAVESLWPPACRCRCRWSRRPTTGCPSRWRRASTSSSRRR